MAATSIHQQTLVGLGTNVQVQDPVTGCPSQAAATEQSWLLHGHGPETEVFLLQRILVLLGWKEHQLAHVDGSM
jgi:hypothetical protein